MKRQLRHPCEAPSQQRCPSISDNVVVVEVERRQLRYPGDSRGRRRRRPGISDMIGAEVEPAKLVRYDCSRGEKLRLLDRLSDVSWPNKSRFFVRGVEHARPLCSRSSACVVALPAVLVLHVICELGWRLSTRFGIKVLAFRHVPRKGPGRGWRKTGKHRSG